MNQASYEFSLRASKRIVCSLIDIPLFAFDHPNLAPHLVSVVVGKLAWEHAASSVNRAVAFYRYLAVIPTELMFNENRLGDHRTDAARTTESGKRNDDMDEKDDQITHLGIVD